MKELKKKYEQEGIQLELDSMVIKVQDLEANCEELRHTVANRDCELIKKIQENKKVEEALLSTQKAHLEAKDANIESQSEIGAHKSTIQKLLESVNTASKENDILISRLESHHSLNTSMLSQLVHLKSILTHTKENNDALTFENEQLKMTLGSNFNELTPRPKWGILQGEFKEVLCIDGSYRSLIIRKGLHLSECEEDIERYGTVA
jgi:regulator of replication initiation timing